MVSPPGRSDGNIIYTGINTKFTGVLGRMQAPWTFPAR